MTDLRSDAPRHFLNLDDFDATTLRGMLAHAGELKLRLKQGDRPLLLKDKVLAMIFERQSTRTRVSFDCCRGLSISSTRSTKTPPCLRANSQLNKAVRAPPTCK